MSSIVIKQTRALSLPTQALAALGAVTAAVVLPQILHAAGAVSGLGTALGEVFLPMHLPILLVGLLAGPYAGVIAGAASPLVSFALTAMPTAALLPFMMLELAVYGLTAGLCRSIQMPTIGKVLLAQLAGRAVRAAAILITAHTLAASTVPVSMIWTSITAGIFGLALQWTLLPLIVHRVEGAQRENGQ